MNYIIYKNGVEINRIGADKAFAAAYCARHGYTCEPEPQPPTPTREYTADEVISTLLGMEITGNAGGGGDLNP